MKFRLVENIFENNLKQTKYSVNESEDKSTIDKEFKSKDNKNLSEFRLETKERNDDYKSVMLTWKDDDKIVAKVLTDTIPASDNYIWFGSLEITKPYRGYGLSDQIIDYITSKYNSSALAVAKDNEIAIHLYKKHGFKINPDRTDDEYYYMYKGK